MYTQKFLYVWSVLELVHSIDEFEYYLSKGVVFALASNIEDARKTVLDKLSLNRDKFSKPYLIEQAIRKEPHITSSDYAGCFVG